MYQCANSSVSELVHLHICKLVNWYHSLRPMNRNLSFQLLVKVIAPAYLSVAMCAGGRIKTLLKNKQTVFEAIFCHERNTTLPTTTSCWDGRRKAHVLQAGLSNHNAPFDRLRVTSRWGKHATYIAAPLPEPVMVSLSNHPSPSSMWQIIFHHLQPIII